MGARSGGGSAGNSRGGSNGFGSTSKAKASGRKNNPFSASAAMKLMGVDKNAAKLLKSGMFGF